MDSKKPDTFLTGLLRRLLGRDKRPESLIERAVGPPQNPSPENLPGWSRLGFEYKGLEESSEKVGPLALWVLFLRFLDERPWLQFGGYMVLASLVILVLAFFMRNQFHPESVQVAPPMLYQPSEPGASRMDVVTGLAEKVPVLYGMEPGPVGKDLLTYQPSSVQGILTPKEIRDNYPKNSVPISKDQLAARIKGSSDEGFGSGGGGAAGGEAMEFGGAASGGGGAAAGGPPDRTSLIRPLPSDLPTRLPEKDRARSIYGSVGGADTGLGKLQGTVIPEKGFERTTDDDCLKNMSSGMGPESFSQSFSQCVQDKGMSGYAQSLKNGVWTNVHKMGAGDHIDQNLEKYNPKAWADSGGKALLLSIVEHSWDAQNCLITPCTLETKVTDNRCDYFGEGCLDK